MRYHSVMPPPSLTLTLQPSRWYARAALGLHLLAGGAVLLADLHVAVQLTVLAALGASLVGAMREREVVDLHGRRDGSLAVRSGDDWVEARLLPDSTVLPWLVVLRYRLPDARGPGARVVLPDSLPADDFRHLRVWLRWRANLDGACQDPPDVRAGRPSI